MDCRDAPATKRKDGDPINKGVGQFGAAQTGNLPDNRILSINSRKISIVITQMHKDTGSTL
jgi:hypothetical protein